VGDLIEIVGRLREQGIQFKSLPEPFDTTEHGGRAVLSYRGSVRSNAASADQREDPRRSLRRGREAGAVADRPWSRRAESPPHNRCVLKTSPTATSRHCLASVPRVSNEHYAALEVVSQ
jgi:DNA invertase Pin-like site-specific DNA recombinase